MMSIKKKKTNQIQNKTETANADRSKRQEARKSAEQIYMRYSELTGNLKFAIIKETADK